MSVRKPTRAETEVRGPDEYEDLDWPGGHHPFYDRPTHRITEPHVPVIAAGICPGCGEVGHTQAQRDAWRAAGSHGYPCKVTQ